MSILAMSCDLCVYSTTCKHLQPNHISPLECMMCMMHCVNAYIFGLVLEYHPMRYFYDTLKKSFRKCESSRAGIPARLNRFDIAFA